MITNDGDPLWPMNAVTLLSSRFGLIDPDVMVLMRRLLPSDPVQCIGVAAANWSPDPQSYEMRGTISTEPSIQRYNINVQSMIKDTDQQRGIAVHSKMSKIVRGIMLADVPLRNSLQSLTSVLYGVEERFLRMTVPLQRYLSTEVSGQFVYLSTIEVTIETENANG